MALYKSNGFSIGGETFPTDANLTEKDFPTKEHIELCLNNGNIELVDENVDDAEFDEYESMKVDELKELLIESGVNPEDFKNNKKADLIKLLRDEKQV